MSVIGLVGGWGYNNLGDEAILAGYLSSLKGRHDLAVSSVDPERTRTAQGDDSLHLVAEGRAGGLHRTGILCGGGYLNGGWQPEVALKVRRLRKDLAGSQRIVHGVEVRGFSTRRRTGGIRALVAGADIAVRDDESAAELAALGSAETEVLPDSIALLYPHLDRYLDAVDALEGKVLVNLLDIADRGDSNEAGVPVAAWTRFCADLLEHLGDRAVGLVVGGGDYRFMRRWRDLPLVAPDTVRGLVSSIGSAAGLISVRMHPALLGTMLRIPTWSVPYCGKVRPTLTRIGVESSLLTTLQVAEVERGLADSAPDFTSVWNEARDINADWLFPRLEGSR